ncbi:MAG: phosphoribosylglycinamide formyltransferase [Planctomycetaceae bacterium]|nr:phosphoribosylglycinamide formyltransferase [Planctomycetaceae bacterium]
MGSKIVISDVGEAAPIRLAVLISGGGTTLVNLVREIEAGRLNARIVQVISSKAACGGIDRAAEAGLPCDVILRKEYASTEAFCDAIFARCREAEAELVICGGFLAFLKVPSDFALRVMNIHPSLIPAFCGKGYHGRAVHEAALARGVKWSGCTIHFVDDEYDHGPIISQHIVPVLEGDTPDMLASRVFEAECMAYPEAIRSFAAGRLTVEGSWVRVAPPEA